MDVEKGLGNSLGLRIHPCQANRMKESGKTIKQDGKGKISYEREEGEEFEGTSWEGEFRNGKIWNVTIYLKDRSIYGEYKDGEIVDD